MATTVTLKSNAIDISGSTSGTTTLQATAVAGTTTLTLPAATDTLVGKATTDTLTNKTLTSPVIATITNTGTLTLPTGTGTILSSANPQSGGVIQVVNATYTTATSTASASYVDTGLSATITPKFNTSKILVLVNVAGCFSGSATVGGWAITDGSNNVLLQFEGLTGYGIAASLSYGEVGTNYLHSPATTSAFTYKVRFKNIAGTGISLNAVTSGVSTSTITLMEIAA